MIGVHRRGGLAAKGEGGDLEELPELTASDRALLRDAGILTRRRLADRVAENGLDAIARDAAVRVRVRDALAGYLLRNAAGEDRTRVRGALVSAGRNWRELVLLVLAVLAIYGIVRALAGPERQVVADRDLPPFHVIGPDDVREQTTPTAFGTFRDSSEVVGRFPLQVIPKGSPLRQEQLSRVQPLQPEKLAGRRIAALRVGARSARLAVPGRPVALLLTPRDPRAAPSAVLEDAIVLDARDGGDTSSVVVALREADLAVLSRLLGSSEVHVVPQVSSARP